MTTTHVLKKEAMSIQVSENCPVNKHVLLAGEFSLTCMYQWNYVFGGTMLCVADNQSTRGTRARISDTTS